MPLHPELRNLTLYCQRIIALDTAQFNLSFKKGKEKGEVRKMMIDVSKQELNEDLDVEVRRLKHLLETFFKTHSSALWENDKSKI